MLIVPLAITIAIVVISPAGAINKTLTAYNVGHIRLDLAPPGGAVTGHPINMILSCYDYYKGPASKTDVIVVYIWVSTLNKYVPIAAIADQPANAQIKQFWNNTPVYLEVDGVVIRNNLKQVADKELDVWMENTWTCYGYCKGANEVLIANLTVPVGPLDYTGLPSIFGSTFTVPPLEATFRQITESWQETETMLMPSGTTTITSIRRDASVSVEMPAWFNADYIASGRINHDSYYE
jgi:hypothetical protein